MKNSEINVGYTYMLGLFEIWKVVVMGLLKSIKVDYQEMYPKLLREAREEIAEIFKIFVFSLVIGLGLVCKEMSWAK